MWVSFLEKAMAKVHKGYEYIHVANAAIGLRTLTGAPTTEFEHKVTPDIFDQLLEAE